MVDEVSGAEATSRRTRVLVVVPVLLLLAGVAVDRWRLDRERTAPLATVEEAEGTVEASLGSLLPLVDYAGPLLTSADVPASSRRPALVTLSRDAARWEPRIRAREDLVDDAVACGRRARRRRGHPERVRRLLGRGAVESGAARRGSRSPGPALA